MRSYICKTNFKYAPMYTGWAKNNGHKVYIHTNEEGEEFFCVDVLKDDLYWRSQDVEKQTCNGVTEIIFKKENQDA